MNYHNSTHLNRNSASLPCTRSSSDLHIFYKPSEIHLSQSRSYEGRQTLTLRFISSYRNSGSCTEKGAQIGKESSSKHWDLSTKKQQLPLSVYLLPETLSVLSFIGVSWDQTCQEKSQRAYIGLVFPWIFSVLLFNASSILQLRWEDNSIQQGLAQAFL